MVDIAFAPAQRLAKMIRQRKIGCLELLGHYLDRVERYNPTLNAIIATDLNAARKRARSADRALAKGEVWGPFHGVPMTVKEAIQVSGLPTTFGAPQSPFALQSRPESRLLARSTAGSPFREKARASAAAGRLEWRDCEGAPA
jgi:Asp-tRNA(Asn)/Glu-tRNA(Gln) amidotransferase A subunit family amidase